MFSFKSHVWNQTRTILPFFCFGVILFGLSGCAGWHEKNVTRHGIQFDRLKTEELQLQPGTTVIKGRLADNCEIDGFPCARGVIVFHDNWVLKEFKLYRSHSWQDFVMPAATWVFSDCLGNVATCVFPSDVQIQGHLCFGGKGGVAGIQTSFHKNGSLRSYISRKDVVVNGIPCLGSVSYPITLYKNGQLQSCTLARTVVIEGQELLRKTRINFDDSGAFAGVD
jgi:hypothetical protein